MKNQPISYLLSLCILAALLSSCSKEYSASGFTKTVAEDDSFNLTIHFRPMADTLPLALDTATYTNFWREKYTVSAFKFYISKLDLINADSGRVYHLNSNKYFLVDAADSSTWNIKLLAAPFVYNRISFLIGIDSARTLAGPQTGSLDPAKGMFWNTGNGYIMAKLEGHSPVSTQPGKKITYHIGGYSGTNNALRKPTLLFPFGQSLQVAAAPFRKHHLYIDADLSAWFYNPHQVKISITPECTAPGLMAKDISENYSNMFSVMNVVN